ncbi:MAG: PIN domain-containing protein [Desulfobacteraceae bacterium]|nr:PIN domain-containing protein [Desulfobacteraceae bacterium]
MIDRLLDSVILIDHLNDLEPATAYIKSLDPDKTAVSVITYAEIMVGISGADKDTARSFLYQFTILSIEPEIAETAAELRQKNRWKLPDAFQAALAVYHHLRLVTRNTKDFSPERHAFVEIPYTL